MTPGKRREYQERWLAKPGNLEKSKASTKRWKAAHPEKVRLYAERAQIKAAVQAIEVQVYAEVLGDILGNW